MGFFGGQPLNFFGKWKDIFFVIWKATEYNRTDSCGISVDHF